MSLDRKKTKLFFILLLAFPLIAEEKDSATLSSSNMVPDVPSFTITYQGEDLICSPVELIKTNSNKNMVRYECQKAHDDVKSKITEDVEPGHSETRRLREEVKEKIAEGAKYSVEIPLYDAKSPRRSRVIAERQLSDMPYGKYIRKFLPAKLYLSLRPQLANSGDDGEVELVNGSSRGGFFYYHHFNNDMELIFHYEAGVNLQDGVSFINVSDSSDTNRRLSYFRLRSTDHSVIVGKYWSAYYDIAGLTDQFMAFGAQASGAFGGGAGGTLSGTGRADKMIQVRTKQDAYDATLQVQYKHGAGRSWGTDYSYTMAGSVIYKEWEDIRLGASFAYGKFDEETPQMQADGINGDDWSSILGFTYKRDHFTGNAVLSYTKNHMRDDQGMYFDSAGAELYLRYDIDESIRLAGGGNWLFPEDNGYEGEFSIRNVIMSLQYTFGEKTFDDMVYIEVSLPQGKFANGESKDTRVAVGLRYLLDY